MVELICIACGRTNQSDAKFCSQCGAALLRRFCDRCHAVNDADAHFCRSCGAALPQQSQPGTLTPKPDDSHARQRTGVPIPTLNEVLPADEAGVVTTAETVQPLQGLSSGPVDDAAPGDGVPQAMRPARRTVLLAVGGLVVLLVAAALWSRAPRSDVVPHDASEASVRGAASGDVPPPEPAPSVAPAPASGTTAGISAPVESSAPAASGVSKAGESGTETVPTPSEAPQPATPPRKIATEPRRPAATNRPPRGTVTPAPSPSNTPASECTRQLNALGLCAPGATTNGR